MEPKSLGASLPRSFSSGSFNALSMTVIVVVAMMASLLTPSAHAAVSAITLQSPTLNAQQSANVTTPAHFLATAESTLSITGYVVYIDGQNAFQNHAISLDAWIILQPGTTHSVYVTAWDSSGALISTPEYTINVTTAAPPVPPLISTRLFNVDNGGWVVDNAGGVGGTCNDGSIGSFNQSSDPNTNNAPNYGHAGQHFILNSKCRYDDSLFYRKDTTNPSPYVGSTNFLWDFWVYIPTTTQTSNIQALEFDMFQAIPLSDGVHEYMFGSQCNYISNQWQFWLPEGSGLGWTNSGASPCQLSPGSWHHLTYYSQRVTGSGYQIIPSNFSPSSDTNTKLRFGTLTVDGNTIYLGTLAFSTIPKPAWGPVLGVQHQLDSSVSGVKIEQFTSKESVTTW